jgi:hypothetical protein
MRVMDMVIKSIIDIVGAVLPCIALAAMIGILKMCLKDKQHNVYIKFLGVTFDIRQAKQDSRRNAQEKS